MVNIFDDQTLLDHCRKQDRFAQKILFNTYYKKMMPVCLRYLKSEGDALEVLNNAFLKVFAKINQYKSEGSLESWIKRIVINSSIDFVRSNKVYKASFIHTNEFELYGQPDEESETGYDWPDEALDFTKEEIFEMVAELPNATRIVFNLFVIDEFSHKQICENLKIRIGTSKWHLSNARKMLKAKINLAITAKNRNVNHG